jgi:hypothetical protein
LVPSSDSGDDFFGVFGSSKWLGGLIMFRQVSIGGGLEVDNAAEL